MTYKTRDIPSCICYNLLHRARVVELVDTLALGASALGREGSSPFARTKSKSRSAGLLFDLVKIMICNEKKTPKRPLFGKRRSLHFRNYDCPPQQLPIRPASHFYLDMIIP